MKKIVLVIIVFISFNFSSWAQPDYAKIRFHSTIKEYKKSKPSMDAVDFKKADILSIITALGSEFYNEEEIKDITEKVWLALINPKQFDYVFKDIAVQSIPNWNKKNFKGEIVIEPNPFLAKWTNAQNDILYFKGALGQLLTFYKLMGYNEKAKGVKTNLSKMLYTKKYRFRPIRSDDWTSYYLYSANAVIKPKGLTTMISNFDYFVCKVDKKEELVTLFQKMDWYFDVPEK